MTGLPRDSEIDHLIQLLSKLPGLGPRSARRIVLYLIRRKEALLMPLAQAMLAASQRVRACSICGNLDTLEPCAICSDRRRDTKLICVVEEVADLWAMERSGVFRGQYHVLSGTLSALEGVGPEDLGISRLIDRVRVNQVKEVILATNATVEGQTTAHYICDVLEPTDVSISQLAHGVPIGGELEYLDDGTLTAALKSRRSMPSRIHDSD